MSVAESVSSSIEEASQELAGSLLWQAREMADLTQAQLAGRAAVPASMVSAIERGIRQPTLPTLLKLIHATGHELRTHLTEADAQSELTDSLARSRPLERAAWVREQAEITS